jgi:hypothetical protein
MRATTKLISFVLLSSAILCLMASSLGLAAIGAARYAAGISESGTIPAWLPYIFGGAVDLLKATMLAAGFGWIGFRARPALCLACLMLGAVALVISLTVQHSSLIYSLQEIERHATHKNEARSDLRAELREVEDRMAAIKAERTPRPTTVIAWAIKTVVIPAAARRNSEDCTTPGEAYTRKTCAPLLELRKELAEAEELERLEPRAAMLRKQVADAQIVASRDPAATSFELLVSTFFTKAGKKKIDGTVGFPGLMILLLEMVSALGLYIIGEMHAVLWSAVATDKEIQCSTRKAAKVEAAANSPDRGVGEFKSLPNGRAHQRARGENRTNTKPAQGNLSEVVSSRSSNIIMGRFGSSAQGRLKPSQGPVASGATSCPITLALNAAQPAHGHVAEPADGTLALAVSEPAHEVGTAPAESVVAQLEGAHNKVAFDAAAKRAVAAFIFMLDKGEGLRASGSVLFTFYNLKGAMYGWPKLTATAFGILLRKAVMAAGGSKIKSGGQIYVGVGVPAAWQAQIA